MKISPLQNYNSCGVSYNKLNKNQNGVNQNEIKDSYPFVSASYMLAFTGGRSLDLAQTKAQIDKFGSYPPDIKEDIEFELSKGNPDNKTLIDIHRAKYDGLNQLDNLDDIKEIYPEFKQVLSDNEVIYPKGSFIDDVKEGKIEYFDPDLDLSVQLLQMYWGDGFSLNDLKNQFAGKNIDSVLNKLNIPKTDRIYGQYLKLSDRDYNERFTSQMSERLKGVKRKEIEKKEGVYIPRGPLTEEHKANISKGLIKFYSEHPERLTQLSERQLKYFEENPEQKQIFSEVLLRAWGYRETKSVKKALSKHMKRQMQDNELSDVFSPTAETKQKMKLFWDKNKWARDIFSKAMKKSWQRQKDLGELNLLREPFYIAKAMPDKIAGDLEVYAKDELPDIKKYMRAIIASNEDRLLNKQNEKQLKAIEISGRYFRENPEASVEMANTFALMFPIALKRLKNIVNTKGQSKAPSCEDVFDAWKITVQSGKMQANQYRDLYSAVLKRAYELNDLTTIKELEAAIEPAYRIVVSSKSDKEINYKFNLLCGELFYE